MICFRCIGGIGNQMFLYAAARAFQLRQREDVILLYDKKTKNSILTEYPYDLTALNIYSKLLDTHLTFEDAVKDWRVEKTFASIARKLLPRIKKLGEKPEYAVMKLMQPIWNLGGSYQVGHRVQMPSNMRLTKHLICEGYFQSSLYFKEYRGILQEELRIKGEVFETNKELIHKIKENESVCVHVRRGDYTALKDLLICTCEYYQKAVKYMKKLHPNAMYFVFSDDAKWAEHNIMWPENTIFVEKFRGVNENSQIYMNPFIDLQAMYECKHFIISNSSFSWWAQFLSRNMKKTVIAPDRWQRNYVIQDIYEDFWKLIEV